MSSDETEMDKLNDLMTWLLQFSNTTAPNSTHFSLVGGKWEIPAKHHNEFLRLYAMVLQKTEFPHSPVVFFVERKTEIFRMHFDLDIVQQNAATKSEILEWTKVFTTACQTYYPSVTQPDNTFVCYISKAATTKRVKGWEREAIDSIKTGVHLIWPNLLVDQIQALYLREACIAAAKLQWGERIAPANPWADMIDESVLLKNGLRMVGSDKSQACKLCNGDKKLMAICTISACKYGRVRENRPYLPYRVLNERLEEDSVRLSEVVDEEDCLKRVELFTTRSLVTTATSGFVVPEIAAIPSSLPRPRKVQNRELLTSDDRENPRERAATLRALSGSTTVSISPSDTLFKLVGDFFKSQTFERSFGGVQWAHLELKKLFVFPGTSRYLVKVGGLGSHFCLNVGRQHASSTIYFVIDSFGMRQRCFCTKIGTEKVSCKKFASQYCVLPVLLTMSLFASDNDAAPLREIVQDDGRSGFGGVTGEVHCGSRVSDVSTRATTQAVPQEFVEIQGSQMVSHVNGGGGQTRVSEPEEGEGWGRSEIGEEVLSTSDAGMVFQTSPVVVTPITGYVDERKQMVAVEAVRKLNLSANKRKLEAVAAANKAKRELGPAAVAAHAPKRFKFAGDDFSTKEINSMACIDIINHDRKLMAITFDTARQVQDESFKLCAKPKLQTKVRKTPGVKGGRAAGAKA